MAFSRRSPANFITLVLVEQGQDKEVVYVLFMRRNLHFLRIQEIQQRAQCKQQKMHIVQACEAKFLEKISTMDFAILHAQ